MFHLVLYIWVFVPCAVCNICFIFQLVCSTSDHNHLPFDVHCTLVFCWERGHVVHTDRFIFSHLSRSANLFLSLFSLMLDSGVPDIALEPDKTVQKVGVDHSFSLYLSPSLSFSASLLLCFSPSLSPSLSLSIFLSGFSLEFLQLVVHYA